MGKKNLLLHIQSKVGSIDLKGRFEDLEKFRIPTGILAIDRVLGGGIPAGKLTELYGDYSSGKSRISGHILAETQKLGGIAALLDTERSLDKGLVELTGIDSGLLVYPEPSKKLVTIESVFETIQEIMDLRQADPDCLLTIVWDSVASTPGMEDLENALGANTASMRRAKVISDGLKKIMAEVYRSKTVLIFINQIRDKIGVLYGEKTDTVGGKALKFAASVRLHCRLAGKIKDPKSEEQIGGKGVLVVEKSKVGKPFGMVRFEMMTDKPIDRYSGYLEYLARHGDVVNEGRGWFRFPDEKKNFREVDFPEAFERRRAEK